MTGRQRLSRNRLRICLAIVCLVFAIFGARLFQIQGIDSQAYASMAVKAGTTKVTVPAPRGKITDRNGVALAASTNGLTLTADPSMTSANATKIAGILVKTLGDDIDYFDTVAKLRTPKSRFVYLIHQLPQWKANKALTAISKAGYVGVFGQKESIRTYPGGSVAANLIGFLNGEDKGVAGLEQQYNKKLTGKNGSSTFEVSPTGQRIPMADDTVSKMTPGSDVTTTVDRDLQWYSDQRLSDAVQAAGGDWGIAITTDVRTGQVMAMSQTPSFNPETKAGQTPQNTIDRAVQNVYEPGSVQKTLTFSALADQGKVTPSTKIVVPSQINIDGFRIADDWGHGVLHLTAEGVLALSSNLGTIVASHAMSSKDLHDYLSTFGLGRKTNVGLPGEEYGILPALKSWNEAKHDTVAFGQGVAVTAMQMVRAVGAIANGGVMVDPSVVSGFVSPDGKKTPAPETKRTRVMSKNASAIVTRMMEAVTQPGGTAPMTAIKGYRVAGKTGTAWRVDPNTGKYVPGQYTVSFMGFAPADNPRFLTYVVIDRPHSSSTGGATAGPVFRDIMSMALERFGVEPSGSETPKSKLNW